MDRADKYLAKQAKKELKRADKMVPRDLEQDLSVAKTLEEEDKELLDEKQLDQDDKEFQKEAISAGKKLLTKNPWYLKAKTQTIAKTQTKSKKTKKAKKR